MKLLLVLPVLFILTTNVSQGQNLKDIKVFYSNQKENGKKEYFEFKGVGEDPWSKPEKLDIVLSLNHKSSNPEDKVEILIEELYEPTHLKPKSSLEITNKCWVPHKVVFSDMASAIKSNKVVVKGWPYQTAYFTDSMLYRKLSFRLVGLYYHKKTNHVEKVLKVFNYED